MWRQRASWNVGDGGIGADCDVAGIGHIDYTRAREAYKI